MDEVESTFLKLKAERERERDKLLRRIENAQDQLRGVQLELGGLEAALLRYRQEQGVETPAEMLEIDQELRERFRNMEHKDILIEIARDHGGLLVAIEVLPIMVKAALFPDKRGASNSFYRTTGRFPDIFRKVRRGVYTLAAPASNGTEAKSADQRALTQPPPST